MSISTCEGFCVSLGERCDAYDFGGGGSWCGIWGTSFTKADNTTFGGLAFTWASGSGSPSEHVCRALTGQPNVCYHRKALSCEGGGGGTAQCLPGCSPATCGL